MAEIHSITVYLGATIPKNPIYVDAVRKLGRLMAAHGLTLVFGGSKEGTMEILADEILHVLLGGQFQLVKNIHLLRFIRREKF